MIFGRNKNKNRDEVEVASDDSFPASDAPSHTPMTGISHAHPEKQGRMGGGMMKKTAMFGAGLLAVAAGIWQFKRRR